MSTTRRWTQEEIPEELEEFLDVVGPRQNGEWDMLCPDPNHDDHNPSASLSLNKGLWFCHGCSRGGPIEELALEIKRRNLKPRSGRPKTSAQALVMEISDDVVEEMANALARNRGATETIIAARGVTKRTLSRFQIGWDSSQSAYSIPIYDVDGRLLNIRFYDPTPGNRRKIWSVSGHGSAVLFPVESLEREQLLICEGEWDTMLAIQHGINAITRTGAAGVWEEQWSRLLAGKEILICHDMDTAGQLANKKVHISVSRYASSAEIIALPYEVTESGGKDITDYLYHDGGDPALLRPRATTTAARTVSVLDSLGGLVGEHLKMEVTVTGRVTTTNLVPLDASFMCDNSYTKCEFCSLNGHGSGEVHIDRRDPLILELIGVGTEHRRKRILELAGIPSGCPKVDVEHRVQTPVEELFVRPSIDQDEAEFGSYVNRSIYVVGRHGDMPNSTVAVEGSVFPSPRDGKNVFMAWDAHPTVTSIDNFEIDAGMIDRLSAFTAEEDPLDKCLDIASDLADNVTMIYGRPYMHVFMDLVFHSVLGFYFGGRSESRGWIDGLIIGDTRTGKSEAALRLIQHYGLGQLVSCESATFAGVVGGLEQMGGKEWVVRWGVIPLNDRRAVVLDEVSGLRPEQIGQMSSIRSSGVAQLTKIQSESTLARTRLLWLGNPRPQHGKLANTLDQFSHGVLAILPLIGTAEDIARFDMAMCVRNDDVSSSDINVIGKVPSAHIYTNDLCHDLLRWVWTRQPGDVMWRRGAEDLARELAVKLGSRYVPAPPLIQAANVRLKIARIACALAARTFSTNREGKHVVVRTDHVEAAVDFLDIIYSQPGFGYATLSGVMRQAEIRDQDVLDTGFELNNPTLSLMNKPDGFTIDQFAVAMNSDLSYARGVLGNLVHAGFVSGSDNGFCCSEAGFRWIRRKFEEL